MLRTLTEPVSWASMIVDAHTDVWLELVVPDAKPSLERLALL
jgi:hypothetical protein